MSEKKKIVITGEKITEQQQLDISTTLANSKYFLLTGIVYTPDSKPLPNAAVVVYYYDDTVNPPTKEYAGMTFTASDGTYGIVLETNTQYMLITYS